MERTISFMNGEGSLGHNTRAFIASNVDADRTKDNITLVNENLKQVYHKLYDDSLKKYNAKQKRKGRQIKDYYEKISRSKQEKLFYEVIVQIGNRDDTGVGSEAADIAVKVLTDYVELFISRNPQLYVFGAYIHMDEETPHVHIDFVPFSTDNKRGLETKNSLKGALASRGFESEGKGNTEWQQWSEAEKEDIAIIMEKYGISWKKLDTHKPHLSVLDYKKQERSREVKELEQELEDIGVVIELKEEREARLNREINKQELQLKKNREEAEKVKKEMEEIETNEYYEVEKLTHSIPYLIPSAAQLLEDIGHNFQDSLRNLNASVYKIKVTSVTRTVDDVKNLKKRNTNSSQNSAHRYGTTFDVSWARYTKVDESDTLNIDKDRLKMVLAMVLRDLKREERCYVKHERKQGCFHITVREKK